MSLASRAARIAEASKTRKQDKRRSVAKARLAPSVRMAVEQTMLRQCETKRSSRAAQGTNLNHNQTFYLGSLFRTTPDTGNPDGTNHWPGPRVGSEILAQGLSVKLYLERLPGFHNSHFKVIIFKYNAQTSLGDSAFWQGLNGDGQSNILRVIDTVQTGNVKILKQLIIKPAFGFDHHVERNFYINLRNERVRYYADTGIGHLLPEKHDLGMAVVACNQSADSYGTHLADMSYAVKLTYKDP